MLLIQAVSVAEFAEDNFPTHCAGCFYLMSGQVRNRLFQVWGSYQLQKSKSNFDLGHVTQHSWGTFINEKKLKFPLLTTPPPSEIHF